jgi:hypothetical protein
MIDVRDDGDITELGGGHSGDRWEGKAAHCRGTAGVTATSAALFILILKADGGIRPFRRALPYARTGPPLPVQGPEASACGA